MGAKKPEDARKVLNKQLNFSRRKTKKGGTNYEKVNVFGGQFGHRDERHGTAEFFGAWGWAAVAP
jgi:hypothetical protein